MRGWRPEMPVPTTETGQFLNFLLHLCNFLVSPINKWVKNVFIAVVTTYQLDENLTTFFVYSLAKTPKIGYLLSPRATLAAICKYHVWPSTQKKVGAGFSILYSTCTSRKFVGFSWTTISLLTKSRKGLQSQVAVRMEYLMLLFFLFLYWRGLHADTC